MLAGSFLVFLAVPSWMLYVENIYCFIRIWFLTLGLTLLIGSSLLLLMAQMYPDRLSDKVMIIILGVFFLFDVVVLSVGTGIIEPRLNIVVPQVPPDLVGTVKDGNIWLTQDYYECIYISQNIYSEYPYAAYEIFMGFIITFKGILLVFGFYFSLYVYKHAKRIWFDSKPIIFALYNSIMWTLLCTVIVYALHHSNLSNWHLSFLFRSICIFLGGTLTPTILFHPDTRRKVGYTSIQGKETIYLQ